MNAAVEVTLTIEPPGPADSSGSSAWVTRSVPSTLTENMACQSSGSAVATGSAPNAPPALFTSTSSSSPSPAANSRTDSASVTSSRAGRTPVSFARVSSRSSRRAAAITSNPSATSRRAVAAPIPLLAPVTTAVRVMR